MVDRLGKSVTTPRGFSVPSLEQPVHRHEEKQIAYMQQRADYRNALPKIDVRAKELEQ